MDEVDVVHHELEVLVSVPQRDLHDQVLVDYHRGQAVHGAVGLHVSVGVHQDVEGERGLLVKLGAVLREEHARLFLLHVGHFYDRLDPFLLPFQGLLLLFLSLEDVVEVHLVQTQRVLEDFPAFVVLLHYLEDPLFLYCFQHFSFEKIFDVVLASESLFFCFGQFAFLQHVQKQVQGLLSRSHLDERGLQIVNLQRFLLL